MSWELVVRQNFSSAHFLREYKGKCEKMHGHTFTVEVYIRTSEVDRSGVSIDFTEIKKELKKMLPDHEVLNDIFDFSPSAENLSRHFYHALKKRYNVSRVMVWESENAGASYSED